MLRFALCLFFVSTTVYAEIDTKCDFGKECRIEVPGARCADGTPSFFTLTKRKGAKNLLVYVSGGGACWDRFTCKHHVARPLTRVETPTDWTGGTGIENSRDAANPFRADYDVVTVPYCTGDVHIGDSKMNYGGLKPLVIEHHGYKNFTATLEQVRAMYPAPEKAVMVGCSAGALGATVHLGNFSKAFPNSRRYVVSDAGTPFKAPYLDEAKLHRNMVNWGGAKNLPEGVHDFNEMIAYNTRNFPDVRFGLISSYRDKTMTFFATIMGAPQPRFAVTDAIDDAADHAIGSAENAKVFFTESNVHCHTPFVLGGVTSQGVSLGQWLGDLVNDGAGWDSHRP